MTFNARDKKYMKAALEEAEAGHLRGDFPVGAVLTIDNKLIGKACNGNNTVFSLTEHAESRLINTYSTTIKQAKKKNKGAKVELYTTLEPCLMCLGTSILGRVDRLIYACRDPNGGAAGLDPNNLEDWYAGHWPIIEEGLFREEGYEVVTRGMRAESDRWGRILGMFEEMKSKW